MILTRNRNLGFFRHVRETFLVDEKAAARLYDAVAVRIMEACNLPPVTAQTILDQMDYAYQILQLKEFDPYVPRWSDPTQQGEAVPDVQPSNILGALKMVKAKGIDRELRRNLTRKELSTHNRPKNVTIGGVTFENLLGFQYTTQVGGELYRAGYDHGVWTIDVLGMGYWEALNSEQYGTGVEAVKALAEVLKTKKTAKKTASFEYLASR